MQDEQRRHLIEAVLKVIAVAVAVGLVIALGAFVMVKSLGFSDNTPPAHSSLPNGSASPSALPTVALGSPSATETSGTAGSSTPSPTNKPKKKPAIQMSATPISVQPMERINITGTWRAHDNVALQVQRKENGAWTDFAGVQAQVQVGTFTTYVMTSRAGANRFRVRDPASGKVSNAVAVTVN
ncbi:MAG: hypothetical protein ABI873_01870 [Marmoricola sp.]